MTVYTKQGCEAFSMQVNSLAVVADGSLTHSPWLWVQIRAPQKASWN